MTLARPFFFLVAISACTLSVMAADDPAAAQAVGSAQISVSQLSAQPDQQFVIHGEKPITVNHPPVPNAPLAMLDDGTCYTMRTYKVKPKEHFADGEKGSRGYSTCELAKNYQVRSAIAHARTTDNAQK